MTVTQLIAEFFAGSLLYAAMSEVQQLQFQLYAAQGGFQGASSGTSVVRA